MKQGRQSHAGGTWDGTGTAPETGTWEYRRQERGRYPSLRKTVTEARKGSHENRCVERNSIKGKRLRDSKSRQVQRIHEVIRR